MMVGFSSPSPKVDFVVLLRFLVFGTVLLLEVSFPTKLLSLLHGVSLAVYGCLGFNGG